MATRIITAGNATPTIYFMARSTTTGQGLTAKAYGDFTVYYTATKTDGSGEGPTQVSLTGAGTLNAYNSGTCIKVSDTNAPGLYQLCLPSGVTTATYREVRVSIVCTGMIDVSETLIITAADMQTDIRSQVDGSQTAANVEQAAYYTLDIMRMLGTAGTAIGRTATVAANVYTISAGGNLTSEHVGRWCVIVNALGTVSHVNPRSR